MSKSYLRTPSENLRSFGELFDVSRKVHFNDSVEVKDICEGKHGGNTESRLAFNVIKSKMSATQERILDAIRRSPDGLTCDGLAVIFNANPNEISGRLSELKRDGKIYKSGRRATRSGNMAAILKAT